MWLVAIAWIYVVGLMSLTETSIVAGVMTFLFYCVVPLSILYYLTGSKRRRHKALRAEQVARNAAAAAVIPPLEPKAGTDTPATGSDGGAT